MVTSALLPCEHGLGKACAAVAVTHVHGVHGIHVCLCASLPDNMCDSLEPVARPSRTILSC